ncbi:MAG: ribonuclease P protein component [Dehalococcoidia bacterium]|nr:MAG: ribonuclease P protein component [Dehalococcoidia bacterium]
MRREQRLTRERDFEAVFSKGRSWSNNLVVLRALPNELGLNRYGFSVGKRLGKAVVRNRVKRLLREGAKLTPTKDGWDVVFIARQKAAEADYHTLKGAIEELLSRARLLGSEEKEA